MGEKDRLELIGERWGKVRRGTRVFLVEEKEFPTFEGRTHKLNPGMYEIEGFYADAVKLVQGEGYPLGRDFVIPSIRLREFFACKVR